MKHKLIFMRLQFIKSFFINLSGRNKSCHRLANVSIVQRTPHPLATIHPLHPLRSRRMQLCFVGLSLFSNIPLVPLVADFPEVHFALGGW